jgi:hypothetical protein
VTRVRLFNLLLGLVFILLGLGTGWLAFRNDEGLNPAVDRRLLLVPAILVVVGIGRIIRRKPPRA